MIKKSKPQCESHDVVFIGEVFSSHGNNHDMYFIEDIVQRPYAWLAKDIRCLIDEFFLLQEKVSKGDSLMYVDFGDIQVSDLEPYNKTDKLISYEDKGIRLYSEIDGSQRCRTYLVFYVGLNLIKEYYSGNGAECFDIKLLHNSFGEIKFSGIDTSDLKDLYDLLSKTPISKIVKNKYINSIESKFESGKAKDNLISLLYYIIFLINERISSYLEDEDAIIEDMEASAGSLVSEDEKIVNFINDSIKTLLERVYGHQAFVPYENKYDKFNDLNAKGEPLEDKERLPRILLNIFQKEKEAFYKRFVDLRDVCNECETTKRFVPGRCIKDCIVYIMLEAFKIILLKNHQNNFNKKAFKSIFSSKFDLDDVKYGLKALIDKKIVFNNSNELDEYFDICIDMAKFVLNDSFTRHNESADDYFYFQNYSGGECVWQYFIKPLYILHISRYSIEEKEHLKDLLYRTCYLFYTLTKGFNNTTNVQSLINLMEDISKTMLALRNEPLGVLINELETAIGHYQQLNSFDWGDYVVHLKTISYCSKNERLIMKKILFSIEYFLRKKYSLDTTVLYNISVNWKDYDLDHIRPKSMENDCDEDEQVLINSIGNITLLENVSNKRKNDNITKNSSAYVQSDIFSTKLLNKEYYGNFSNDEMMKINDEKCVFRVDKENLDKDFSDEIIKTRRNSIVSFVCGFMKTSFEY